MVQWIQLTQNQYFGFFALGLAFFALQELPYAIMPLMHLKTNVLMEMQDKSAILNVFEKIIGISCIIVMLFLVRGDAQWFSLGGTKEIVFFSVAMMAILGYFIGLWRGNYILAGLGGLFLIIHISNVWNNLKMCRCYN